jgi:hypothetical protein
MSFMLVFLCSCGTQVVAGNSTRTSPNDSVQNPPQSNNTITAVPNRPTFSNTAETMQKGVFEIEYGFEAADGHQNINGLLKFGLFKNLELHFASNPFEGDAGSSGMGDSAVALKYRIFRERSALPTLSLQYTAVLPAAGDSLGADGIGHAIAVLISKDLGKHHLDFNEVVELRSRSHSDDFDRDYFTALAYSHALTTKMGITAEVSGYSRVNSETPHTLAILQALTYNASSRFPDGVTHFGCSMI